MAWSREFGYTYCKPGGTSQKSELKPVFNKLEFKVRVSLTVIGNPSLFLQKDNLGIYDMYHLFLYVCSDEKVLAYN